MRDPAVFGSSFQRAPSDHYPTPPDLIEVLSQVRLPPGDIWEPAARGGAIANYFARQGRRVVATDITTGWDFLSCDLPDEGIAAIVTNPPFSRLTGFIERGLWHMGNNDGISTLVLLARHDHETAAHRFPLFMRAAERWVCPWRPRWIAGSTGQPRWSFVWWLWRAGHNGPPTTRAGRRTRS